MKRIMILTIALLCARSLLAEQEIKGYTGLYMGHSFFRPSMEQLKELMPDTSVVGHTQYKVTAGGPNGSPGMLWQNEEKRAAGQKVLDTKKIDLLVMTYYSPENSSVEHYSQWIDYAISKNPETTFMLALPWGKHLFKADQAEIDTHKKKSLELNNTLIAELRKKYPQNKILYCPYGLGTYELIERFHVSELPGIKTLLDPDKKTRKQTQQRNEQLFKDELGHPSELIAKTGALLWMQTLYNYDLTTLPPQRANGLPGIDLNEIAATVSKKIQPLNGDQPKVVKSKVKCN
jgi:hypothetical protein